MSVRPAVRGGRSAANAAHVAAPGALAACFDPVGERCLRRPIALDVASWRRERLQGGFSTLARRTVSCSCCAEPPVDRGRNCDPLYAHMRCCTESGSLSGSASAAVGDLRLSMEFRVTELKSTCIRPASTHMYGRAADVRALAHRPLYIHTHTHTHLKFK